MKYFQQKNCEIFSIYFVMCISITTVVAMKNPLEMEEKGVLPPSTIFPPLRFVNNQLRFSDDKLRLPAQTALI